MFTFVDVGEMTLLMQDTTEMTLETKNFPLVVDPSPPDVWGLDDHFLVEELSTEGQFIGFSGSQSTSVGVSRSCKK